jgi:hypothetical protein
MREDGTWAGNMELQATSLVTGCNICIHQVQSHALCFAAEGFVEDN